MRYGTVYIHPPEGASMPAASHVEDLTHTDTTTAPSTQRGLFIGVLWLPQLTLYLKGDAKATCLT